MRFKIAIVGALIAVVAIPATAGASWIKVRRKGADGILDAARSAATQKRWGAVFRAKVSRGHPLADATVHIAREPIPAKKGQPQQYRSSVVIEGVGGRVALALEGDTITMRLPGSKKPAKGTGKGLFTMVPRVNVPLALFVMHDIARLYDAKLEGEFGGTAVLRLTPKYGGLKGLQACKVGVSKRNRFPEMAEFGHGDARKGVKLAWTGIEKVQGQLVPRGLRIMRMGKRTYLDFERVALLMGARAKHLRFGKKAVR